MHRQRVVAEDTLGHSACRCPDPAIESQLLFVCGSRALWGRLQGALSFELALVQAEPVRTDDTPAQVLEEEPRRGVDPEFFGEFARGRRRVGLARAHGATDQPVVLAGEAGDVIGAPVDEDPTVRVAADRGGDPVQPPSADGLASIHHPHCPVLLVHSLHHLPHGGHAATEPLG